MSSTIENYTHELEFPIETVTGAEFAVSVGVTDEEYDLLKKYVLINEDINNGDNEEDEVTEFFDIDELKSLYDRVISAALDEAANAAYENQMPELSNEEYSFDQTREYLEESYNFTAEFPDIDQFEDVE